MALTTRKTSSLFVKPFEWSGGSRNQAAGGEVGGVEVDDKCANFFETCGPEREGSGDRWRRKRVLGEL